MHLRRAQPFFEWNLNTAIIIFGFGITWGVLKTNVNDLGADQVALAQRVSAVETRVSADEQDIREEKAWRAAHEATAKDRRGEIEAGLSSLGTAANALDQRVDGVEAKTDRQADRQAANDAKLAEALVSLQEVQKSVTDIQSDQKVILSYVDEQRRRAEGKTR